MQLSPFTTYLCLLGIPAEEDPIKDVSIISAAMQGNLKQKAYLNALPKVDLKC